MKKPNLHLSRKWIVIGFFLPLLILSFQNCTPVNFETLGLKTLKSEGNGGSYGGKPSGEYYRFIPSFTCENKTAPAAIIDLRNSQIQLIENKKILCGAKTQILDPIQTDFSSYQNEVIGYREGIFEGESTAPTKIPANLVEVWCDPGKDEQSIESITHFDRESNLAVSRIYYSLNGMQRMVPDFSVSRVVGDKTVTVRNASGFELIVHRDKPAAQFGFFKASFTAVIEKQPILREANCRLGGSLDPKIWPAQQIVDLDIQLFKSSPDAKSFGYTSTSASRPFGLAGPLGPPLLYTSTSDGQSTQRLDVGTPSTQQGVRNFVFSPDSQSVIYNVDAGGGWTPSLYRAALSNAANIRLSARIDTPSASVSPNFRFSDDGADVIYQDGSQDNGNALQSRVWLRSVPAAGGSPQVLNSLTVQAPVQATGVVSPQSLGVNILDALAFYTKDGSTIYGPQVPTLPNYNWVSNPYEINISPGGVSPAPRLHWMNNSVFNYDLSKIKKRAVYFAGGPSPELYSAVYSSSTTAASSVLKITPTLPGPDWHFDFFSSVVIPYSGDNAIVKARGATNQLSVKYFVVAVDGSGSLDLPENWAWMFSSPDANLVYLQGWHSSQVFDQRNQFMNIKTQAQFALPTMNEARFTRDSRTLFGTEILNASPSDLRLSPTKDQVLRPVSFATADGIAKPLCPGVFGNPVQVQEIRPNEFVVLAFNSYQHILNIYLQSDLMPCRKVNSVPIEDANSNMIRDISLSPDGLKILAKIGIGIYTSGVIADETKSQLFYIPLDGRPALTVSAPIFAEGTVAQSYFLPDSKTVIYLGNQIIPGEKNVFLWSAP